MTTTGRRRHRGRPSPRISRKSRAATCGRRTARCTARCWPSARPGGSTSTSSSFPTSRTAIDFQKKGGYELYHSPQAAAYPAEYLSVPGGYFFTGVDFAGICYNTERVPAAEAPKTWKDLLDPRWKGAISCKIASGMQFVQWYELRKLYGDDFWKSFAKQLPHAFDSAACSCSTGWRKGDDKVTRAGRIRGLSAVKNKGATVAFVAPPDGLPATPLVVGTVSKAPHPEAARLFVDWAMSPRGQALYQNNLYLYYPSVRNDAPPMLTGVRLRDFKLLVADRHGRLRSPQPCQSS